MKSARQQAMEIIAATDKGQLVQAALAAVRMEKEDAKFCADLVYGVLRTRLLLCQMLSTRLPKLDRLPYAMRIALELAVYSLFFQNGSAPYAVINETVKLIKSKFGQRMANVGNASLRSLAGEVLQEPEKSEPVEKWAQFFSVPEDISNLWIHAYGYEIAKLLMKRSFDRPCAALRINKHHPAGKKLLQELAACKNCQKIGRAGVAFHSGQVPESIIGHDCEYWQRCGALSWQAAGSQLILEELGIYDAWGDIPVWDACAGFGGKTLAMLENGLNVRVATDMSRKRLQNLPRECKRLGVMMPAAIIADLRRSPLVKWHGNILADAPCSGLGVLARRPDIKNRFNLQAAAKTAILQQSLLKMFAKLLLPGRELAYMTCTLNPDENERQIERLLQTDSRLEVLKQWQTSHEHPWLEGMFGCRLIKKR